MSLGNMPVTESRGFIFEQAEMDAELHLLKMFAEPEVRRRVVDRVPSYHHQKVHFSCRHVTNQVAQRLDLQNWIGFNRVGVDDCLSNVAESLIHRVCQN